MEKINLLYITYYTLPEAQGGAPLYTHQLAKFFAKKDLQVTVIGRGRTRYSKDIVYLDSVRYVHLKKFQYALPFFKRIIDKFIFYPIGNFAFIKKEIQKAHLVHIMSTVFAYPFGYSARRYAKKIIFSITEDMWSNFNLLASSTFLKYQQYQLRLALKISDAVITQSDFIYEKIKHEYPNYALKIKKIYVGIDPEFIKLYKFYSENSNLLKTTLPQKFLIHHPKILMLGSLSYGKNYQTAIRAISVLKKKGLSPLLVICGTGSYFKKLLTLSNLLNVQNNILFLGEVNHKSIPKYAAMCDMNLHLSLSEGSHPSNALAEFLITGKPTIVAATADKGNLLKDVVLRLDNPFNYKKLAELIYLLYKDKDYAEYLGKKAKKLATQLFDIQQLFKHTETLYSQILNL